MKGLKEQNNIIYSILQHCSCSSMTFVQWQKVCKELPQNIVRKTIILQLAKNTNLFRWKKVLSSDCG